MAKNFALIGAAGYIAPRHMQAIAETGNNLKCALDKSDSVGILDRYFENVDFFTEFERFDRHVEMLRTKSTADKIDYVSICSPNYFHDAHMRFALRIGAHAICEKPLVLNPWNLDALETLEEQSETNIYNVLQLRLHKSIIALKEKIEKKANDKKHEIVLTYITSRGKWYDYSWKGDQEKSGGVPTNIGIHFFDMLTWIFGDVQNHQVHINEKRKASGFIELEKANVRWYLSLDRNDLPEQAVNDGKTTFRSITIDGDEIEFSGGFTDLHTEIYKDILNGGGFRISHARTSVELAYQIRHAKIEKPGNEEAHPFLLL
ncbi:MAG: gfo/Idh/MocA family oxidoreductase [Calditrichaeota bacterium]|nr:MAG: gfo/Idh/MocA family oxidoreductase [Calditrichota bacterium]MBL1206671.1 gfo/Idh/MocA family oxidoreductase [Calditrichota bacterium]NOG46498.1 Gfo/Idh/MocA family oxidoreductase [Calditrichota bacterium]